MYYVLEAFGSENRDITYHQRRTVANWKPAWQFVSSILIRNLDRPWSATSLAQIAQLVYLDHSPGEFAWAVRCRFILMHLRPSAWAFFTNQKDGGDLEEMLPTFFSAYIFLRFCLLVVFSIFDWRVYPKQPTFQREVGSEAHSVVTRSFLISFRWLYSHLRRGPLPARRKISVNIRYVSNILLSC